MEKKKVKILAIDDNRDNLIVLKALINDAFPGALYFDADSGKKGIDIANTEKPDVILLDIVMPGMDGYEVCSKLKTDLRLKEIPVIMVTANRADKDSRVKALEAGADAFLPKPIDESELKAQIRAMLRIKESEDLKKEEKQRLEDMVLDRTEALEIELADRKKAEKKLILSLDKITRNRQAIMNLMQDLRAEMGERKAVEKNINEKIRELQFLNKLATDLSSLEPEENIGVFMLSRLKEFTGSEFLVYSEFDHESKMFITRHIDADKAIISRLIKVSSNKILNTPAPLNISEESFREMVTEVVTEKKSLNEASFGAIPKIIDKAFSSFTGIERYIGLSYVVSGEIYGTTLIGLKSTQNNPSTELLKSFAHIIAVSMQRRRAETTLKVSEEKFRVLIQNQGEGVGVLDLEEKFVFANPAAEEMFGVEPGRLINRNMLDFVPEDHKHLILAESKSRIKTLKSNYEVEIIRPGGEKRTVLLTATPQFNKEGKLEGTFGVFRDITERKLMEQKIIESEAYYRTLIDISPDGIIIADLEGLVSYGSIKALEIFGVPSGTTVIGTSILNWLAPDHQQTVIERISDIITGNIEPETREYKLKKNDGTVFWGELSSSPLSDTNGAPIAIMIVCRDISYRKKAEAELIKSKEKAEESDRLKTAFLHNISHEIRTPMNAIIGFSSLLNEPDVDNESRRSYIDTINQSSNQLLSIVSDIIEISNIEAGILRLNLKGVKLNSVMTSLYNDFRYKMTEKGIAFKLVNGFSDNESFIKADETKLARIITCLLSNSLKFTAEGTIEFGYIVKADNIEFYVTDTGIGISEENHNRIFDRFFQVENSVSRQYEGTGLGLSISKAYVELMGGRIWLTSQIGKGTTFCFSMPFIPTERLLTPEEKTLKSSSGGGARKKSLLVAEDEENNFRLIVELLCTMNLNIIHAVNGKEAVDIFKSNQGIDLIIMDIKMPVMDGYEATAIIKKIRQSVPVIAQTAFAFESDREKILAAGFDEYISKPIKKTMFIDLINKYL